jgi:hypothetical protein
MTEGDEAAAPVGEAQARAARARLRALAARALPYGPALAASSVIGGLCMRAVLAEAGGPALPLDDAFIHLQFARRLAEGGFFSYVAGEGYSSGATSVLWPLLLAPFHAIGFRDLSLVYVLWALGVAFHAALAVETARLARPLVGPAAAAGAGAMSAACGAFAWFAWSGMETVAFAWLLIRTARLAAAWCEPAAALGARVDDVALRTDADAGAPPPAEARPLGGAVALALSGFAAPLLRPEGALASLLAALALAACPAGGRPPRARRRPARLLALAPLAGALVVPAMNRLLAGHPTSSTTTVKWLFGNPNYDAAALRAATLDNVRRLLTDVLDGGPWTAVFLPQGASIPIFFGAIALVACARRRRRPVHAAFVGAVALATLLPCTYLTFLWNRVRYIWPFAPAWFVMAACFAREIGDAAERARRSLTYVTPLLVGAFAGALAARLPWAIRDLAQSARAIAQQQVWLGRWAAGHLPEDATIGVNDTGAIAYLGGRRTFDVVGLTTEGEARYWVAGAGSRFEHYERMAPARRPTHFIVYPQWMACAPVLGRPLVDATVVDQSILGGPTMVAYEARWDTLGSGAAPTRMAAGERIVDEVDVSDLESEAAHAYEVGPLADQLNHAMLLAAPEDDAPGEPEAMRPEIADGGRFQRAIDRFTVRLDPPLDGARLVMRVAAEEEVVLAVTAAGEEVGTVAVPAGSWVERAVALPSARLTGSAQVEITPRRDGAFHAFHYWVVAR